MALGGRYTVRGYREVTILRDNSFIASVEPRFPLLRWANGEPMVQFAPFMDVAHGWNLGDNRPSVTAPITNFPDTLASVGAGLRWNILPNDRASFEVYWGHQLNDVPTYRQHDPGSWSASGHCGQSVLKREMLSECASQKCALSCNSMRSETRSMLRSSELQSFESNFASDRRTSCHDEYDMRSICQARLLLILATGFMLAKASGTVAALEPTPDTLMEQGLQAYQRGSFDQALAAWKQAADLYERDGKIEEQSQALAQAAQASESLGQVSQALQQLELALTLAQQTGDRARIAAVMESLGRTYLAARKPDAAVQYLTQALAMAQADEYPMDRRLIAAIHNDLGIAHVAQQHDADALAAFATSAQEAQAAGDRPLTVRAHINAARMALKLNQPDNARDWLDLAFDALKDFEPSHDKAMNLIQVGLGYQQLRASMPAMNAPLLLRAAGVLLEATTVAEQSATRGCAPMPMAISGTCMKPNIATTRPCN